MDQKDIEMIIYLNEYGNMVDTAERLYCTQSAVSLRLKKLEDELGVNIFDRIGKRLYLSEKGKLVLDYALKEQNNYKVLLDEIHESESIIELKIGAALPYVGGAIKAINELKERYANVNFVFCSGTTDEIEHMLYLNKIDVAIVTEKEENQDTSIREVKTYTIAKKMYAHVDSDLFKKDEYSYYDLKDMNFVCANYSIAVNQLTNAFKKYGIVPNIVFKSNEVASLFLLEIDKNTIISFPRFIEPYFKNLKPLMLDTSEFEAKALVVMKKGRKLLEKEKSLIEEYVKELDKLFKTNY